LLDWIYLSLQEAPPVALDELEFQHLGPVRFSDAASTFRRPFATMCSFTGSKPQGGMKPNRGVMVGKVEVKDSEDSGP
jgi:hypothetical protein